MAVRAQRRIGLSALLGLGAGLARRGPMAVFSLIVAGLTVLVAAVVAISFAGRGEGAPAHDVPLVASSALAWGGGFLLAFSSAASALRRDRAEGVREFFMTRTTSMRGYLLARVGGLAALLALVVAGGTALTGMLAILASMKIGVLPMTLQASAAAVAYGLAYAVTLAPVAFAALGTRTRMGGYFFLILVLVLPGMLSSILGRALPEELLEVISIPSALAALRASIAPGTTDVFRFVRAVMALFVFVVAAMLWIRRDISRMEREPVGAV